MNTDLQDAAPSSSRSSHRLRIAYLTSNDPNDRRSWSGTHYYMARAVEKHCGDVTYIGPIKIPSMFVRKILRKAIHKVTGKTYLYTHTISLARRVSHIAEERMRGQSFDAIVAPAGAGQIAYLNTRIPIIYISDTTFSLIVDYYPEFSNLFPFCRREGEQIEKSAIAKASLAIFSSSWAAKSACRDYLAEPGRVHVLPFGANLDERPVQGDADHFDTSVCRLLFLGVEWQRKGGDIAFETLVRLEQLGVPAELTVVGCVPPSNICHPKLKVIPFLNKNDDVGRHRLSDLLRSATFLLLPTRADCTPIVMCEALAFGLPVVSTDTGGISELIQDAKNGILLPLEARGDRYGDAIANLLSEEHVYAQMRRDCLDTFRTRLNWDTWGESLHRLILSVVKGDVA